MYVAGVSGDGRRGETEGDNGVDFCSEAVRVPGPEFAFGGGAVVLPGVGCGQGHGRGHG
jgi:hypothetical protein